MKKAKHVAVSLLAVLIFCWCLTYVVVFIDADVSYDIKGDVRFRETKINNCKEMVGHRGVLLSDYEKQELFNLLKKVNFRLLPRCEVGPFDRRNVYFLDSCIRWNARYFYFRDSGDLILLGIPIMPTSGLSLKESERLRLIVKQIIARVEEEPLAFRLRMYDYEHEPFYRYVYTNEFCAPYR